MLAILCAYARILRRSPWYGSGSRISECCRGRRDVELTKFCFHVPNVAAVSYTSNTPQMILAIIQAPVLPHCSGTLLVQAAALRGGAADHHGLAVPPGPQVQCAAMQESAEIHARPKECKMAEPRNTA